MPLLNRRSSCSKPSESRSSTRMRLHHLALTRTTPGWAGPRRSLRHVAEPVDSSRSRGRGPAGRPRAPGPPAKRRHPSGSRRAAAARGPGGNVVPTRRRPPLSHRLQGEASFGTSRRGTPGFSGARFPPSSFAPCSHRRGRQGEASIRTQPCRGNAGRGRNLGPAESSAPAVSPRRLPRGDRRREATARLSGTSGGPGNAPPLPPPSDMGASTGKPPRRRNPGTRGTVKPFPESVSPPLPSQGLTRRGIDQEAAAPRQPGGAGEGLALPRADCSPSPRAR